MTLIANEGGRPTGGVSALLDEAFTDRRARDVLLVVGNGLAINLAHHFPRRLSRWDTSAPTAWDLRSPGRPDRTLLDVMPTLASHVRDIRAARPGASDFDVFETVLAETTVAALPLRGTAESIEVWRPVIELRHFLALAYSRYQDVADSVVTSPQWPWLRFVREHLARIQGIVSFNYDLNIETALAAAGASVRRVGVIGSRGAVPVFKAHGSIDYQPHRSIFGRSPARLGYPLRALAEVNNFEIEVIDRKALYKPRIEVDLVIPGEATQYHGFRWVLPGWQWIRDENANRRVLLLVGLSYWEVDQAELNAIIDSTPPEARAVVADPCPNRALTARLRARFGRKRVSVWQSGDPEGI